MRNMRAMATTVEPKPMMTTELLLPAGNMEPLASPANRVRRVLVKLRTSVLGKLITVVMRVAGWAA